MREPTLLQQARYFLDAARERRVGADVRDRCLRDAIERVLRHLEAQHAAASGPVQGDSQQPVPMLLHSPQCTARHIDDGEFATKPHHTHACQSCGFVWRPALVPTVGVQWLPGFKGEPPVRRPPVPTASQARELAAAAVEAAGVPMPERIDVSYRTLQPGESMQLPPREDGSGPIAVKNVSAQVLYVNVDEVRAPAPAMPEDELIELQRLCDAATPGPWRMCPKRVYFLAADGSPVCDIDDFDNYGPIELRGNGAAVSGNRPAGSMDANADFICAAREALPRLIAQVRQLRSVAELSERRSLILMRMTAPVCLACNNKRKGLHCADCAGELKVDSDGMYYVPLQSDEVDHA